MQVGSADAVDLHFFLRPPISGVERTEERAISSEVGNSDGNTPQPVKEE
jgi:hypothetical protein